MSYRVEFETRARKEFLDLPNEAVRRLSPVFDDLAADPRPPGAKKLAGVDGYRIRKGDYRVLYKIDDKNRLVRVFRVGHRREVYRRP
ncbi:MAG: type II toxin-antitoxin system RelE/ParE family toxin [Elusimicrobia bacterium]|nr:type II toxin-antitoxin system RelE/ParE family toxin [Elusimicrobiota bacterium]